MLRRDCRQLLSWLKATVNRLENSPQLFLWLVVLLLQLTPTPMVPKLGSIFLGDGLELVVVSIAVSFLSFVRGEVNFVRAELNLGLSTVGVLLIWTYSSLSLIARGFAYPLLVTPTLGLFSTRAMTYMAAVPAAANANKYFDFAVDGRPIYLADVWKEFHTTSGFDHTTVTFACLLCLIPVLTFGSRFALSACIKRWFLRLPSTPASWLVLFGDWREMALLRTNDLAVYWKKTRMAFLLYDLWYIFEPLVLLVPLIVEIAKVSERAARMEASMLPLLPQETISIFVMDCLLYGSIAFYVLVLPLLKWMLVRLYFKYGHPLSPILRKEAKIFPWDSLPAPN